MSRLNERMQDLTSGNMASAATLRRMFDVPDRSGGGDGRRLDTAPELKHKFDLA